MSLVDQIIDGVIRREGGYVDNPDDKGGPTKYGVTLATLSKYRGMHCTADDVRALKLEEAFNILTQLYVRDPNFDRVVGVDEMVGAELVDTGINMGQTVAATYLQRALNVLNVKGQLYPDVVVDGRLGSVTLAALRTYLTTRNRSVLLTALNCLQGARYIELCELRERNETFVYGWLAQRVRLP